MDASTQVLAFQGNWFLWNLKKKAQQTSHKNCHDLDQSSFVQVQGHCLKMQNSCLVISCNGKLLEANIDWYRDCLVPENMSWPKALVIRTSSKSLEKMVQLRKLYFPSEGNHLWGCSQYLYFKFQLPYLHAHLIKIRSCMAIAWHQEKS